MNPVTSQMQNFARRLITYEASAGKPTETTRMTGFQVCEKLRVYLASFMGQTGFRTLLSRALALSTAEVPWLSAVRVKPDWSLDGLDELQAEIAPDKFFQGGVVLLAQLLGLLVAFIGENLTLRMVREVWPKIPLQDLDFGNAEKNGDGGQNEYRGKNEKNS